MHRVSFLFALLTLAFASPLHAEAAFAVAIPEGGFRDGFAYGAATSYQTGQLAQQEAMSECRDQARKFDVPPDRCKVILSFRKQCVSVAFDRTNYWVGWAIGDTSDKAAANAITKCLEGGKDCETAGVHCDE